MRIDIITIFPGMFRGFLEESIANRAQQKGLAEIVIHNLRDYSIDKRKSVDDYAFGGGPGMVMTPQPLVDCIESLQKERKYDEIIFLTPDGELFTQALANELSMKNNIAMVCGHYKGIDQRVRDGWITREISIGDYVLSGGELPAAVLTDALVRLIPGVISDESSALSDSFQGDLLDAPVYTRPADFRGMKVPEVLVSGDFAKIAEWLYQASAEKTKKRRPGMIDE